MRRLMRMGGWRGGRRRAGWLTVKDSDVSVAEIDVDDDEPLEHAANSSESSGIGLSTRNACAPFALDPPYSRPALPS